MSRINFTHKIIVGSISSKNRILDTRHARLLSIRYNRKNLPATSWTKGIILKAFTTWFEKNKTWIQFSLHVSGRMSSSGSHPDRNGWTFRWSLISQTYSGWT